MPSDVFFGKSHAAAVQSGYVNAFGEIFQIRALNENHGLRDSAVLESSKQEPLICDTANIKYGG